jgi:serine phosphatase RsbU (regulator of sigma subunit)
MVLGAEASKYLFGGFIYEHVASANPSFGHVLQRGSPMARKSEHKMSPETSSPHGLQCMEIWGGNHPADHAASTPGLDIRVISRPLDAAGGDVHYVSLCGGGALTRMLLADVSGHGAPVAEFAGDLRKLIRKYINTKSQTRLVSRLNDRMEALSLDGLFATSLVATYHATTRWLTLSNAGHPRPLLFRSSTGAWELLDMAPTVSGDISNLPLGIQKGTTYSQTSIQLEAGDRVVLYTDLLIETHDPAGNPLGEQGVLDVVRRLPHNGQSVANNLLEEILSQAGSGSPADDVTILEFCHNGHGPQPPSLSEKLRIYGKVFRLIPV